MNAKIETAETTNGYDVLPITNIRCVLNGIIDNVETGENAYREIGIHLRNGEKIAIIAEGDIGTKRFIYCVSSMWKGKLWPFLTVRRSC